MYVYDWPCAITFGMQLAYPISKMYDQFWCLTPALVYTAADGFGGRFSPTLISR